MFSVDTRVCIRYSFIYWTGKFNVWECSSMVEPLTSNQMMRVRSPSFSRDRNIGSSLAGAAVRLWLKVVGSSPTPYSRRGGSINLLPPLFLLLQSPVILPGNNFPQTLFKIFRQGLFTRTKNNLREVWGIFPFFDIEKDSFDSLESCMFYKAPSWPDHT